MLVLISFLSVPAYSATFQGGVTEQGTSGSSRIIDKNTGEGIGGADIKLSTAAALSLGFYGGVIGYMIGLVFAITVQLLTNKAKKRSNNEPFPLLPFLSTGLMIGYFI